MSRIYGMVMQAIKSGIGSKTDAADAAGSANAKLAYIIPAAVNAQGTVASANVKLTSATERTTTSTSYVKVKSIMVTRPGTVRASFAFKCTHGYNTSNAYIYINGVATTNGVAVAPTTYTTYSYDVAVKPGDTVEVWYRAATGSTSYIKDFSISYDSGSAIPTQILD